MANDVPEAAVEFLSLDTALLTLVGQFGDGTPWIFANQTYAIIKGTGKVGLTLEVRGAWQPPNLHNTMQFPRLVVMANSDPTRDSQGNIVTQDAMSKAAAVLEEVSLRLHRPNNYGWLHSDNTYVRAGKLRILKSHKLTEPDYIPVADGDGLLEGQVFYALTVG